MATFDDIAQDTLKGEALHDMRDQFRLFETEVQFIGEPYAPAGGALLQAVPIDATSPTAVRIIQTEVRQIKVDITGGSATGKKLKSADGTVIGVVDGSITVKLVKGRADIIVEATSTGTVTLALDGTVDARAAVLDTTDTATVTFS